MRKQKLYAVLIPLAIALMIEIFVFNFSALTSLGKSWTPLPAPEITGNLETDKKITLRFCGVNQEIQRLHIAVELFGGDGQPSRYAKTLQIRYSDEGNAYPYTAGSVEYSTADSVTCYLQPNSYGKVHDLEVAVQTEASCKTYRLVAAEINGNVPFRVSPLRLFIVFLLMALGWLLRHSPRLQDNRIWNRDSRLKAWSVAGILIVNILMIFCMEASNGSMFYPAWAHHSQYQRLAQALSEGRTWIDTPEQAETMRRLSEMENPYDTGARDKVLQGKRSEVWDMAFYRGHLYVYFGVVPVLLTYLPFYLLMGMDLSTAFVAWIAYSLILIGAFFCLRALVRRYFPKLPFAAYLALSVLLGNCTGVLTFAMSPSFYTVPIAYGLAFVLLALALWISAAERWEILLGRHAAPTDPDLLCFVPLSATPSSTEIGWRIVLGSLFAALVAGCRPQFLVFTALALPIFLPLMRSEARRRVTLRRMLLFSLPYLAVAIPLMYYNYIRFGSPFDFGANYNLTTNDMTRRGLKLARLPDGLFSYLFALPNIRPKFPFWYAVPFSADYLGKTIYEKMFGGALATFPFLWLLFAVRRVRGTLREKKLRLFFWLPLALAVLVVMADTEMAGILWRYTGDYLMLLYLPAALVACAILEKAEDWRQAKLTRALILATAASLLICILIAVADSHMSLTVLEMLS